MSTHRLPLLASTGSRGSSLRIANEVRPQDTAYQPRYAVWELTLRCDLSCRHCGSRAGRARVDELTLDEALRLVDELADLGIKEVTLIGGEAYLYPQWLDVVRAIRARDMLCTMTTAGRGITQDMAIDAAAAGLGSVSLSVDGDRDTHDALRGLDGAFDAALRAYDALRQAGIPVAMNTTINRRNLDQIESIFELALEQGCHGWQYFLTVPMGRAVDEDDLILQPSDLAVLLPRLVALVERAQAANMKLLPGNNVGYYGPSDHKLRGLLGAGQQRACAAGRTVVGIEANGDIKGCPSLFTGQWVGGNVRTHKVIDIWQRSDQLRFIRDRTVDSLWGFCRSCYYAKECMAGCSWTSSALFGRPGNNPYCHHRVLELERQGLRERLVRVGNAPGESFDRAQWTIHLEGLSE